MITWVLDNVDSNFIDPTFILLILKEQQDANDLISQLTPLKAKMEFVIVDEVTEGAACTALLAKDLINVDIPLFIANSDQFVEWDVDSFWQDRIKANQGGIDGDVLCFHVPMEKNDTKWSYAAVSDEGYIIDLKEKVVISENATVGLYYWARGRDFVESAEAMIEANDRVKGEFYVAPAYIYGIRRGRKYTVSFCEAMHGLGVPHDFTRFLSDQVRPYRSGHINDVGGEESNIVGQERYFGRTSGPMIFIAHRGNVDGPNPEEENKPEYLLRALSKGFDVEVDAWLDPQTGQWALGHDGPQYPISSEFLRTPGFWIHAKNGAALRAMVQNPHVHCFTHDQDEYTLTSRGFIWAYPDVKLVGTNCIAVMYTKPEKLLDQNIGGICHDSVGPLRNQYIANRKVQDSVCTTSRLIRLVVFDLDGVLVESRDLHYEALNQALEEEAGKQYVINREEHLSVYDGLSTNQKLRMLEVAKGLPRDLHAKVWARKQALTNTLVKKILLPSDHILETVSALKEMGLPVCVASNCIRSSVRTILTHIGLIPHVDVFLSNEDVENPKPAPDIYLRACNIFGVHPSNALVVEDSVKGFEAASRAGCHLLRVSNPGGVTKSALKLRIQELETDTEEILVILPLAGPYPEIWHGNETAEMPLYLADVAGMSALEVIGQSLRSRRFSVRYIFVVKDSVASAFNIDALCARAVDYARLEVVKIKSDSLSSVHTILKIPNEDIPDNMPLLIADGHHVPVWLDGQCLDDLLGSPSDGAVTVMQSIDPRFSYVRLNTTTNRKMQDSNAVIEVTMEGRPTSNLACSGLYFFKQARHFKDAAKIAIKCNRRWLGRFYTAQLFNEMVKCGLMIQAIHLKHCWSLRTVDEIQNYERLAIPALSLSKLVSVYDEMAQRHGQIVDEEGVSHDGLLLQSEIKPSPGRRCLAIFCLCHEGNWKPTTTISSFMEGVKNILGPDHCYYKPMKDGIETVAAGSCEIVRGGGGVLHWTFMQLVGFQLFDKIQIPEGYANVVEGTLLRQLPRISINFSRLVLTSKSIVLLGFPTGDVESARFHLRRALARCGMPLFEPYFNDIVHMTLVRFASPIEGDELATLRKKIEEFQNSLSFGCLFVDQLKLSPATWKMQAQELREYEGDWTTTIKLL